MQLEHQNQTTMKNISQALMLLALIGISCLFFASCADSEEPKRDNHKKDTVPEWLFVHTSPEAQITSDTTLVMPVIREIFAFTDRPNRQHAFIKAHQFVKLWIEDEGNSFKADPPNAVLTWVDDGETKEAEVIITDAKVVEHVAGTAIQYFVQVEAGDVFIGEVDTVSLFIDPCICPTHTCNIVN